MKAIRLFGLAYFFIFLALLASNTVVLAQSKATKEEIAEAFVGKTAVFSDGGEATYRPDRSYTYQGSRSASGTYDIMDGQICVTFRGGNYRCDSIVKEGAAFVLVTRTGAKYSITFK